jgi:peptidoglycan/LPS O-acetylase OafA/YrhL
MSSSSTLPALAVKPALVPVDLAAACETAAVRTKYQAQFDGLRALAVMTVVVDHFGAAIRNFPLPDSVHLGPVAVRLFLVLSGYFITGSLARTRVKVDEGRQGRGRAFGEFYRRRLLRILPPYLLFVAVCLVLGLGSTRQYVGWLLTFSVNLLIAWTGEWPPAMSHLWSICVQEQFYLVWPALIFLLPKRWITLAILGCALVGVAFRVGCVLFSAPLLARWVLPFGSLDALGAGAALAWGGKRWHAALTPRRRRGWLLAGGVCMGMLVVAGTLRNSDPARMASVLVEPLEAVALTCVVAWTADGLSGWPGRALASGPLVYAGRISYGIYIYHVLVSVCMDQWLPGKVRWLVEVPVCRIVFLSAVTLALAALSWEFFEEPINRWRHKKA